jgi:hypothetical protein
MNKIQTLRNEAKQSATLRGHTMTRFVPMLGFDWEPVGWTSRCKVCGWSVEVRTNPAPNQTNIMGEAVTLNCRGEK